MHLFGIAGWSGSGKTTLLVRLIPVLVDRGLKVATIKHTHHNPAVGDEESRALAEAGACETVIASAARFALVHELRAEPEPRLDALVGRFDGIDLLLVEGFKFASHPKLEVFDPELGKPLLAPNDPSVVAMATDAGIETALPRFARDDVAAIGQFIQDYLGISRARE